jgi:hypothetical protein
MSNVFEYYKAVTYTKQELITDQVSEAGYVPFIINRSLSYTNDGLFVANEVNRFPQLDKKLQFDYYFHGLRKRNRFAKWAKKVSSEDLDAIKVFYKYSDRKALDAIAILSEQQIKDIKDRLHKGGK